jgi:tight adherence protein C
VTGLLGGVLGAVMAVGALMIGDRLLANRRPTLESRVAPYIRDVPTMAMHWIPAPPSDRPTSAAMALAEPVLRRAADRLERVLGGRESVRRRLQRSGSPLTVEQFRLSQVVWGLGGCAAAMVVGVLGPAREPGRVLPWVLLCAGSGLAAVLARDTMLSRQVAAREQQILAEFPVVADLLALAVAAGEGPVAALGRVVATCRGALPDELAIVLAQSRTGTPITAALDGLASRTGLAVVSRFAEGFAVAIERGTPLVDVLTAQTADVREAAKRSLIETGARKEVAMMVPVVFFILPVTLLFAFFPGVVGLNLLAP